MVEQKEIQQKLIRYQILESRVNALIKRRDLLITRALEIETTLNSVDDIEKSGGKDILLPIGSSVHVKGELKKVDKMIVELGANTAIESTVEETKRILEKRKKILEDGLASLEREIVSLNNEIMKLQPEIRAMLREIKKPSSDVAD
ncbi:MAG: prefoldin subunit alpha [Candidatus Baldrarchaeia archaeon]